MAPQVSVVVPTYQRRELVMRAVRSVAAQTFRDFELVVVDDGSTDGTRAAVEELGIRCLRQPNRGPAAARNAGIRATGGRLVAFLDSDNRWLPNHLATIVSALGAHEEAVLATSAPRAPSAGLVDPLPRQLVASHVEFVSATAIRRAALEAVGGFDESLPADEDGDLWLRLAFEGPFALLRSRTVAIRSTPDSVWKRSRSSGRFLEGFESSSQRLVEELRDDDPRLLLRRAEGRLAFVHALRALDGGDADAAAHALRRACRLLPELSTEPDAVLRRLTVLVPAARERSGALRVVATAAEAWPDAGAPTALLLRSYAGLVAIRLGRIGEARRLLFGLPAGPALRFAAGSRSLATRVAQRRLERLLR
ncbi:MAG: glycosyltransferase family 2 protein [Actinomycetota bacterium]|nr:glycosyltransferase family 2 protein [Actinomycetota bacterium]